MLSLNGKVRIESHGRSGDIIVSLGGMEVSFWWELGGGNCIATVQVPDPEQWRATYPLRKYPRAEFLEALAAEVSAIQCPGASHSVSGNSIEFHERIAR